MKSSPLLDITITSSPSPHFNRDTAAEVQIRPTAVGAAFVDTFGLQTAAGRPLNADDEVLATSAEDPGTVVLPVVIGGFARLAPGATAAQVRAAFPALDVLPLKDGVRPDGTLPFLFIFGTTVALLLVAWVQVAARASSGSIA